jgi:hypothetical protein
MTATRLTVLFASTVFAGSGLPGQVLVGWDLNGVDLDEGTLTGPSYTLAAGTTATHASGELTLSSSVSPSTGSGDYGFTVSGGDAGAAATLATAISNGHFLQFTVTAAEGYELSVTSITFNGESSSTGADNLALLSSVDGFNDSSVIAQVTGKAGITGGFDTDASGFGSSITLSGMKFAGLSAVTFRIYGWNISSGLGKTALRNLSNDDLEVLGTVAASAVPEPAAFGVFAGLAILGFAVSSRRAIHATHLIAA